MGVSQKDFNVLSKLIKDYCGIAITKDKEYLLESRLLPIANKYGLSDLGELVEYMRENQDESILIEVIEAMTTNESFFFRDTKPFERLQDIIIPHIIKSCPDKKSLRIWSAACSSGQEPYSIAMSILEDERCKDIDFEIIATDLDYSMIEKAKEGIYSQFEVQRGVPVTMLIKYFTQSGDQWHVKDNLKEKIKFSKFNLLEDASSLGEFDIIFCRNVLIYFEEKTKVEVINNLSKTMHKNSVFITGTAESLVGIDSNLTAFEDVVNCFCLKN